MLRDQILTEARTWQGTPFQTLQACKGAGADCVGWIVGTLNTVLEWSVPYPPRDGSPLLFAGTWWQHTTEPKFLAYLQTRPELVEVAAEAAAPADLLIFALSRGRPAHHVGMLVTPYEPLAVARFQHVLPGTRVHEAYLASFRAQWQATFRLRAVEDQDADGS